MNDNALWANQATTQANWQGVQTTHVIDYGQYNQTGIDQNAAVRNAQLQQLQTYIQREVNIMEGHKLIVVCGPYFGNCENMDAAQIKAEELSHEYSKTAYILKPIRSVSPKREVVVKELK